MPPVRMGGAFALTARGSLRLTIRAGASAGSEQLVQELPRLVERLGQGSLDRAGKGGAGAH